MAEIRSALGGPTELRREDTRTGAPALLVRKAPGQALVQVAGWRESFGTVTANLSGILGCNLPADTRKAVQADEITAFMVGPERLWLAAPLEREIMARLHGAFTSDQAVVTDLSHSRTAIRLSGPQAAALLARAVAVDLDERELPVDGFAQTGLHQVGVLLHRQAADVFELWVPRSYAASLWAWLTHVAELLPSTAPRGTDIRETAKRSI